MWPIYVISGLLAYFEFWTCGYAQQYEHTSPCSTWLTARSTIWHLVEFDFDSGSAIVRTVGLFRILLQAGMGIDADMQEYDSSRPTYQHAL